MTEFLIENGANVNSTCSDLKTPLHLTLVLNHEEFVLLLLQNVASWNAKDQDKINPIEEGLKRRQVKFHMSARHVREDSSKDVICKSMKSSTQEKCLISAKHVRRDSKEMII